MEYQGDKSFKYYNWALRENVTKKSYSNQYFELVSNN